MDYNKYIGLSYKDNGRDIDGLDCWGLVRLFYKQELNIDLPSYDGLYTGGTDSAIAEAIDLYKSGWDLVSDGAPGDVCLFNIYGEPAHVGIYIGDNRFLHVRENSDSVVESLSNPQWSKRFVGFYKYKSQNTISTVGRPHPLKSSVLHDHVMVGSTVQDFVDYINKKYNISERLASRLVVLVDDKPINKEDWATTVLQKDQTVAYKTVAQGNTGRMLLMLAVVLIVAEIAPTLAPEMAKAAAAEGASIGAKFAFASFKLGLTMAGMALVNAISPVRMPGQNDPGSPKSLSMFTGSSNQVNRFGAIPVVLGKMRVTGIHGATPYVDTLTDTSILNMLIVWGFGPLTVEDLRVGTNAITSYYDNEFAQNIPAPVTLEGSADDSQVAIDQFNQIYGGDVEQANISPVELTNNSEDGAPWRYAALANECSELAIAFSFPVGMRQVVVSGNGAGNINGAEASVEIQVRKYITSTGENPTDGDAWQSTVPYSLMEYGTNVSSTQLYGYSRTFGSLGTVNANEYGIFDLYKKYVLCLVPGGSIQLLEGCASNTRGDLSTDPYSEGLAILNIIKKGTYASLLGTDKAIYKYEPVVPAAYMPIYSFELFKGALVQEHNTDDESHTPVPADYYTTLLPAYNHTGLELSYTEAKQNGNIYSTTINIKPGKVYNTYADPTNAGEVKDIFNTREMLSDTIGNQIGGWRGWADVINNYGIWDKSNPLTFTTSKNVVFPYTGYYYFSAAADDEGGVYVDNRPAVLIPSPGYNSEVGNLVYLEAGTYPVRVTAKNSGGGACGIGCKITYQLNGGLNNMPTPSTILVFGSPGFYYKRRDGFNFVYRIKNLPRGKYEIRVRRTNDDTTEPSNELRNYNKVQLFSVTGFDYKDSEGNPIRPIKELPGSGTNKAYLARTAIRLQSTNKANGSVDGINAVVQTKCKVWDISTQKWVPNQPTSNPAALFRYVLTHPANAYRVEESEVDSKIDMSAVQAWSEFCDTATAYRPILEYNGILSNTQSVLDTLRDICAAGLASPNFVDGKWTVVVDKPRNYTVQYFTPHNSWGFEATKILPRLPHAFRITFANRDKAYQADEAMIYNYGYTKDNATIFEELHLPGVTNLEQAKFMARWHLAQLKLRPERYSINTDFEYLVCNRGDLVRVTHDVPMWGTGSGRIKSITGNTVGLTEPVFLKTNIQYKIRVRLNDGTSILQDVTNVTNSDWYDTIQVASTNNMVVDNLFMLGEINKETQQLIVLSIEATSNVNAKLTLMDYSPDIYTTDLAAALPNFNANITGRSNDIVRQTISGAPTITSVLSADGISEEISTGTYQNTTIISYSNSPGLSNEAKRVQLQAIAGTEEFNSSSPSYFGEKDVGSITIKGLKTLTIYKFRARYTNATGSNVGPWSEIFYATVVGKTENRYTVPSLTMDLNGTIIVAKPAQDLLKPSDFDSYEYRLYKDTGTEDFWELTPDNTNNIKVQTTTGDASFNLLDIPLPRISTQGITYRVACRTKNRTGNYSTTSALGTIVVKTIQ